MVTRPLPGPQPQFAGLKRDLAILVHAPGKTSWVRTVPPALPPSARAAVFGLAPVPSLGFLSCLSQRAAQVRAAGRGGKILLTADKSGELADAVAQFL